MKSYFMFVLGWFLAIFSTHNFGWESSADLGGILLLMGIFGWIILKTINHVVLVSGDEQ